MLWLLFLLAAAAYPQAPGIDPTSLRQGETIHLRSRDAVSARMGDRVVRLFAQPNGLRLGLMPVPALQKPGAYEIDFLSADGKVLDKAPVTVRDARFPIQNVTMTKAITELKPSPGEMERVAEFRNRVSDTRYWSEPLAAPLAGCMISRFGVRRFHNGKPTGNYHGGLDQRSPVGTPIHAVAAGEVRLVGDYNLHGRVAGVDHGQGLESIYLHMSKVAVREGDRVEKGQVIGYVGSTGRSTGPHLHWSLYVNAIPVNPLQWIPVRSCSPAKPAKKKR